MRARALLTAALLTAGVAVAAPGTAQAATLTFTPTADTFVNSASAGSSFGGQTVARTNATTGNVKIAYVKFAVTGIPTGSTVTSATLTLKTTGTAQPADTARVNNVASTWTESTTYSTRPALGSLAGTAPVSGPSGTVTIAVTVTGNGTVSFAVSDTTAANGDTIFGTREATAALRPVLTVNHGTTEPPPPPPPAPAVFPDCPTTVVRPFPSGTTLTSQYKVGSPGTSTYEFDGVTSTAYPATGSPFAFGTSTPPAHFCMNDGAVAGTTDDAKGWSYYHDTYNASCVRIVATNTVQVHRLDCHDIEDGLKFLENNSSVGNSNTTTFYSSGVHLDRVRDDCMENDFTLGGVLYDSLWERCNTGLSERPASSNGTWTSPAGETVTLDHMLIGLWETWHEADNAMGHNAVFKWSSSANRLVIKCSLFLVPEMSLNGADSMAIPPGTHVDDSACPDNPTTIVWLGGGNYPGNLNGAPIRVTGSRAVWDSAVAAWKTGHGYTP